MKKKLSILLAIVLMFVSPMQASAQEQQYFSDMPAVINRALGAKESVDISSYTDVKPTDWFYGEMSKAVGMGTF